jgi:hypothetical protein
MKIKFEAAAAQRSCVQSKFALVSSREIKITPQRAELRPVDLQIIMLSWFTISNYNSYQFDGHLMRKKSHRLAAK